MTDSKESASAFSEDRYFRILDTAPDAMVVVARDETIAFVNAQAEKLFGYSRAELLGKSLEQLVPERFRQAHSGHVARFVARPGTRPMGSGLPLFGRRADGSEMAIEVSLSPVDTPEGTLVSAAIRDISERKRMEEVVKLNADRLASAVDSIQDAFALFDANERLVQSNSTYRRLRGEATPGPLVGRSYTELALAWMPEIVFASDTERAAFMVLCVPKSAEETRTCDVRTRDGRSLRITDRRTTEGGIVETIWDLTGDQRREEELREARIAAEAGSASKSEFLSSMSHELRTPLNAILGFAQLSQRDKKEPLSPRHAERIAQILKGGEHLLHLIDDILDLSRIEAGAVSISTEPVNAADVMHEVKTTLDPAAARAGVCIAIAALPKRPPMASVDRTRFAQILMNYGSNAIKYNRPNGTVTFAMSLPRPNRIRVTVTDTGKGIPDDKQDKLFQPFQRAGEETGPIEGTGIGLAITKRLAELMNGSVGFTSTPGVGSQFWIEVPAHTDVVAASAQSSPADETVRIDANRRGLVLYVEDNPANVAFMEDLLSGFDGIELITAPTAEIGVETALRRRPKVILMDINLPGMSGIDALRVLQKRSETRSIPVVALTAAASVRDKRRAGQAGFYRYLTKPVKVAELEEALDLLLAR
jgi:PAS domain S-box-containing protein